MVDGPRIGARMRVSKLTTSREGYRLVNSDFDELTPVHSPFGWLSGLNLDMVSGGQYRKSRRRDPARRILDPFVSHA